MIRRIINTVPRPTYIATSFPLAWFFPAKVEPKRPEASQNA
jgi:hypothetical protein